MGLSMKVYLFSATRGVVTRNGQPVENAEVERTYRWGSKNQEGSDKTVTDAQGRFAFDTAWDKSLIHGILPLHQSVAQRIFIRVDGAEYRAWSFPKDNFDDLGEIGRPLELICELTAQDIKREPHRGIAELAPAASHGGTP
jgi:hypothetical protein